MVRFDLGAVGKEGLKRCKAGSRETTEGCHVGQMGWAEGWMAQGRGERWSLIDGTSAEDQGWSLMRLEARGQKDFQGC